MSAADDNQKVTSYLGIPEETIDADNAITAGETYADYGMALSEIAKLSWVTTDDEGNIQIPVLRDSEEGGETNILEGGRAYISFVRPIYLHIDGARDVNGNPTGFDSPAEPADENQGDVNFGTIWDKFEFTVAPNTAGDLQLWSNTSCVDFVGIPMSFSA